MVVGESFIERRGFMFVLSSPSGAGKTTISRKLLEKDNNLIMSISTTTRRKRSDEVSGVDYNFVDKDVFDNMIKNNEFLEYATVFENSYGTPVKIVDESLNKGIDVLFDIDWQGTNQLSALRSNDLVSVFILPPSIVELEKRLRNRASDSEGVIASRMNKAGNEISKWYSYDYVIINYDVDDSINQVISILNAERAKRIRQQGLSKFIQNLLQKK